MATQLFIIPSGKNDGERLMDWGKCRKLQWHIILLLGAGFAIADGFKASGLTDILSDGLGFLKGAPALVIAPVAIQRRHHGVHLRRRRHHAGAAAAWRARQVHRRAPAAALGPRHDRRAAVVPVAHGVAAERRRVRHSVHLHQGHGDHRDAAESRRCRSSHSPAANIRFSHFWHGSEVVGRCTECKS